jgi:hypothetical protein
MGQTRFGSLRIGSSANEPPGSTKKPEYCLKS